MRRREERSLAHTDVGLLIIGIVILAVVAAVSYMTGGVQGLIIGPGLGLLVVAGCLVWRGNKPAE